MPIIIGSLLFGAFAITAALVEADWQVEPKTLTRNKRKRNSRQRS
jgi:hypothetical protein